MRFDLCYLAVLNRCVKLVKKPSCHVQNHLQQIQRCHLLDQILKGSFVIVALTVHCAPYRQHWQKKPKRLKNGHLHEQKKRTENEKKKVQIGSSPSKQNCNSRQSFLAVDLQIPSVVAVQGAGDV